MKTILILCFVIFTAKPIAINPDNLDFVLGVFFGLKLETKAPNFFDCKTYVGHTISLPNQTIDLFKLHHDIQAIQHFFNQLTILIDTCGNFIEESKDFVNEVKQIINAQNFKKQVESNLKEHALYIVKGAVAFNSAIMAGDNFKAGYEVGELASIILWNQTNPL